MSLFKVNVTARNPKREELATQPLSALVDTGSELTWLPADILKGAGITPRRKRVFATATQQRIEREVGYAILSAEGYETNDEVVFAEPGDMTLLGVRTLEGFGVMVDNIAHRFVATTTLVALVNSPSVHHAPGGNGAVKAMGSDAASQPAFPARVVKVYGSQVDWANTVGISEARAARRVPNTRTLNLAQRHTDLQNGIFGFTDFHRQFSSSLLRLVPNALWRWLGYKRNSVPKVLLKVQGFHMAINEQHGCNSLF